jgi:hypothetical protein
VEPRQPGRLRPVPASLLTIAFIVGLIGGWLFQRIYTWRGDIAPVISWTTPAVLFFLAALLGGTAWSTWRSVHVQREPLAAHQAVNRLVLARTCALVGSVIAGFYGGYAVSWLGVEASVGHRIVPSLAAALAGGLILWAAVRLEEACRIDDDDPDAGVGPGA